MPRTSAHRAELLCFHYAGGSAATFRAWPGALPPEVAVTAVQLPGRAERFGERAFDRMEPLVEDLLDSLEGHLDRPFACYGMSMGARVAWHLAHELRRRDRGGPVALYVAASGAPRLDDGFWRWDRHGGDLARYVLEMGGTPAEVLDHPELLDAFLPTLRADLAVLSTHDLEPEVPLHLPIVGFSGVEDEEAPPEQMRAWELETDGPFVLHPMPGGHFFDGDVERRVVGLVGEDLLARLGP